MSNSLQVKFVFAGPVKKNNAFEVELEACMHIWRVLRTQRNKVLNVICTYSKNIQELATIARAGLFDIRHGFEDVKQMVDAFPNCIIKYIKREWNKEADQMANQGREREILVSGWV